VRMESIRMTAPASPARLVIRHSYGDTPIHAIAMAGWHRLVSVGRDNKVRVHNPETGRVLQTFERHSRCCSRPATGSSISIRAASKNSTKQTRHRRPCS
jgi:hypothetical protein